MQFNGPQDISNPCLAPLCATNTNRVVFPGLLLRWARHFIQYV